MEKQHDYKGITTPEAAFEAEAIDINSLEAMFAQVPEKFRGAAIAHMKKMVCTAAINGPAVLNMADTNQKKHLPVWWVEKDGSSGFGLSLDDCVYDGSDAFVGARLSFETKEKGLHYAKNFKDVDKQYFSS